jgi:hypothetical protein
MGRSACAPEASSGRNRGENGGKPKTTHNAKAIGVASTVINVVKDCILCP